MLTYKKFIDHLLKSKYSEEEFINWINDDNKGYKQEAVFIITLYCNLYTNFTNYIVYQSDGFDRGELIPIKSVKTYFTKENINKGGSKCDALLINDIDRKMIVFSSKNVENNNLGNYDIDKINTLHKTYWKHYTLTYGIVSKDSKHTFYAKLNNTRSNKYLKNN